MDFFEKIARYVSKSADLPLGGVEPDGASLYVVSRRANFVYSKAANTWSRQVTYGTWLGTSLIVMSPTGNDDNPGTVPLPILSASELQQRLWSCCNSDGFIDTQVEVLVQSGSYVDDLLLVIPPTTGKGAVYIHGAITKSAPFVLAAVTARIAATNTPLQITVAGHGAWVLGTCVEITASAVPANVGARMWVAKDLGADKALVSSANVTTVASDLVGGFSYTETEVTPTNGDTCVVDTFPVFPRIDISAATGGRLATQNQIIVKNLESLTGSFFCEYSSNSLIVSECKLSTTSGAVWFSATQPNGMWASSNYISENSFGIQANCSSGFGLFLTGGVFFGTDIAQGYFILSGGALCMNNKIDAFANAILDIFDLGSFDSNFSIVSRFGSVTQLENAACLWGTSTGTSLFAGLSGSYVNISGTTWRLAVPHLGASGFGNINGSTTCVRNDPASGAVTAAITISAVNLDTALPAGFGGHAFAVSANAGFVQ